MFVSAMSETTSSGWKSKSEQRAVEMQHNQPYRTARMVEAWNNMNNIGTFGYLEISSHFLREFGSISECVSVKMLSKA